MLFLEIPVSCVVCGIPMSTCHGQTSYFQLASDYCDITQCLIPYESSLAGLDLHVCILVNYESEIIYSSPFIFYDVASIR